MSLKEELKNLDDLIKELEDKRRELYKKSLDAPQDEKLCLDFFARMLAKPGLSTLKFPIEVSGIQTTGEFFGRKKLELVAIRPVTENNQRTYLGIHIGDLPQGVMAWYDRASGMLNLQPGWHNPAIFVPELERVVFGAESWWKPIRSEADLAEITDDHIQNVWYVKLLSQHFTNPPLEPKKEQEA